ncbi:hypothetical protein [Halostagnicola sp. A-GB9-2]|uniref:hypothetical protein n=1 Tax=Halostagnicola sp. A-GB9-2 TaxID=3048066 RepID=UPI0024BF4B32|nr:hypothetical protein [Halostagnicola sp. A-GB9-2]MDJ1434199.1 hypothetical protein [Halostagnicola sp. A-GB9-2]
MYENNTRDLEGLDRSDASLENKPQWTTCSAFERDLLIAIAALENTNNPPATDAITDFLTDWYTTINHADLYQALEELKTKSLLTQNGRRPATYRLTTDGHHLLEAYIADLTTICNPNQITITLERPITPGDLEQAYCKLQQEAYR